MKRLLKKPPPTTEVAKFKKVIQSLQCYDLIDIMRALIDQFGGGHTTALYEALEEAENELEEEEL